MPYSLRIKLHFKCIKGQLNFASSYFPRLLWATRHRVGPSERRYQHSLNSIVGHTWPHLSLVVPKDKTPMSTRVLTLDLIFHLTSARIWPWTCFHMQEKLYVRSWRRITYDLMLSVTLLLKNFLLKHVIIDSPRSHPTLVRIWRKAFISMINLYELIPCSTPCHVFLKMYIWHHYLGKA